MTEPKKHAALKRVLSDIPEPKQRSGLAGATVNLTNAIVGSGIIGIPFTIRESGLVLGLLLLLLVSYLATRSLRMIVETASFHPQLKLVGVKTYEDLMFMPFGSVGSMFILVNKFVFAYGCMVAYLLIIKDTVPVVLGLDSNNDQTQRQLIMVATSLFVMLPLSLMRDMASLACTSLLSVAADVLLIVFMIVYSPVAETVDANGGFGQVLKDNAFNSHVFIGLGIISQAMTCHPQALMIHGSLDDPTSRNWATVTQQSLGIAWLLCTIMGIVGFLGFLDQTQGDILNNFASAGSVAANGSRGLVAITMIFTYPMQAFVARHVVAKLLFNGDSEGDLHVPKWCFCVGRRELLTLTIYIATLIPALMFDDLGPVLSITGAIGGSCLAFIGPGLIYLGAHGSYFIEYTNEMMYKRKTEIPTTTELPAEGDAKAQMATTTSPSSGNGRTPWWWCLVLMPLWRSIAASGSEGMNQNLQALEEESPGCTTVAPTGEVIGPMNGDFYLAMFLIVFGVVALVAGVATNIYVQLVV
ncbi:Putative sodium-coupled neutral amino acid transporter 11 [Seminavis robusta]|uniref:Sodium-coupled neutral amino acid transporter 11 n=1 Tax=Seminavis robusta TaxID=568900 RepID=A0A9N8F2I1_9STRA|nr:Putative sodium-coupled neutral amino acid transporter 11 [Seminavis robusta]|eukprot:Sro2507_g329710.1 Putative sodium-coupled neutral amino acid transporter 11 (527) ;mRNA; f:6292-8000